MRWWIIALSVVVAGCGDDTGGHPDATDADGDVETGAEICDDWVDNDHDLMLDCADPDCAGFPGCAVCGNDLVEPGEDCEPGLPPAACTTNCGSTGTRSCNGFCRWEDECVPPTETCNDLDDDCDGGTDEGIGNCSCNMWVDFETDTGAMNPVNGDCDLPSSIELIADGYEGQGLSVFCSAEYPIPPERAFRISVRARVQDSVVLYTSGSGGFYLRELRRIRFPWTHDRPG